MTSEKTAFKLTNASLPLFVLHVLSADMDRFKEQLAAHVARIPGFFADAPVALSLAALGADESVDLAALCDFLRQQGLCVTGLMDAPPAVRDQAAAAGLGLFPDRAGRAVAEVPSGEANAVAASAPAQAAAPAVTAPAPVPLSRRPTVVVDKTVRAGQRIYAEGTDLVVLAMVNVGAELIADGDIHVYAPLRGRAMAGARGDTAARVYAHHMEAELVAIAGCFKIFEEGVPPEFRGRPTQVLLENERVILRALQEMR